MDPVAGWTRFTLRHPWLSSAVVAVGAGILLALVVQPAVGLGFGLILFFVMGIGQSVQSDRVSEGEKETGRVIEQPGRIGTWVRSHPWLFGVINGAILAVGTVIQGEMESTPLEDSLLLSLLLGGGGFVLSVLAVIAARKRAR